MLNKKAQALVEFVLILPVLIMLIFAVIDFGRIFVSQNQLETLLGKVNNISKDNINYDSIYNEISDHSDMAFNLSLDYGEDGYLTIKLEQQLDIITPGLNIFLPNPYTVNAIRVIKYE